MLRFIYGSQARALGDSMRVFIWLAITVVMLKAAPSQPGSCFLLYEVGVGEVRRQPAATCTVRVTPASTFKIPHSLAALDAGVVAGADTKFAYDGSPVSQASWRRDHTLATAMRDSVVWYFQRIAQRLGAAREREYLRIFDYGNHDSSSGLTTFWLGESLQISPEEQLRFLQKLYADQLPVSPRARQIVLEILKQPSGVVVNATGEHRFDAPWPPDAVVSAKTGSATDRTGADVRWIVGHVARGSRSWIFVSDVVGADVDAMAAVDLAATALRETGVLSPL